MASTRSTSTRNRHRATFKRHQLDCALCNKPIDYTLRTPHPDSFEVDHIIPLARGGSDDLDNQQPTHLHCNRAKAAKLEAELAEALADQARTYITTRTW